MKLVVTALTLPLLWIGSSFADEKPTFSREIAPILWKNCAGCHRSGEVGPFPLLTYKDVAKRADFLAEITQERRMPPWKPEPGFGEFHDARTLTDAEIKLIADWAKAGAPEGNPADLPALPRFADGWQLGTPDLILEMPEAFTIPANGPDIQRCFPIAMPIDGDKTVAAVEFRPGNRRVVHHSILYLTAKGAAKAKDAADAGPGYASFGGPGVVPTGALGGWAPGAFPRRLPDGTARMLKAGNDLIMQIHYHPDGKAETDKSVVGLYFTKTPVKKLVGGIAVRSRDIDIPAGEARHHVEAQSSPLPADYTAIGITPHMHNVAREVKVVAESPDGSTIPLIWIKDWDFNWQGQYQYKTPLRLPKGTIVKMDVYYDNSVANPRNPSSPPRAVKWGEQTTDEMCLLAIQVTADTNADLLKLLTMRGNGLATALVGGVGGAQDRPGAALRKAMTGAGAATKGAADAGASFLIPERFKEQLARFDKNNDGRLSQSEIETLPPAAKERVRQAMQARMKP